MGGMEKDTKPDKPPKIAKEDLLLHPVRMRIILAAASRQEVTVQQLVDDLPDIPQATLYRNLNTLAGAGILVVVKERRLRNTIEKTFSLRRDQLQLSNEDLANARPQDYMRQFTEYLGILMGYYGRYLAKEDQVNLARDGISFNLIPLNLTNTETTTLFKALQETLAPFEKYEPSTERKRRILGVVTLPDLPCG
jgi:DNA-binding transcriptional ArsR family regulator